MRFILYISQFLNNKKKNSFLFFSAVLFSLLFVTGNAYAGCSPYIGKATLNEFFKENSNQSTHANDFAEVKMLDTAITLAIYGSWKIKICENNTGNNNSADGCSALISLSDFTTKATTTPLNPWAVLRDGSIGDHINMKEEFDAVLVDANGHLIDYFTLGNYTDAWNYVSGCALSNLDYDYYFSSSGASAKSIHRNPDGTGDWGKTTSGSDPGTSDDTNDTPPSGTDPLPIISVANISVTKGTDAVFTITLDKTVSYPVSVQYSAQDGDAVEQSNAVLGKYDYTTKTGTISFAAGEISKSITITTEGVDYKNSGSVYFYFYLFNQVNGSILNNYPTGTIAAVSSLHHIEIIHDESALTCTPETLTVKACTNTDVNAACTPATSATTVPLTASGTPITWVGGDIKTFTGSATYSLQKTSVGATTLGINSSTPASTNSTPTCKNSSGTVISCDLTFNDSGFIFDVGTQTSCVTSANIKISAVRKNPTTEQCIPFFDGKAAPLKFWATYADPISGTNKATLNYNAIDYPLDTATTDAGTDITVTFDSSGEANFTLNYADAGQLDLKATYTGSAGTSDDSLSMEGNKLYVTKPAKLYVYSDDLNASCPTGIPTDATCNPAFRKTGENFNLKVRAACADDTVTPNFQLNGITISPNLIAPTGAGTANANLAVTSFDTIAADNGDHTISTQNVDQVGVFTFTAALPAAGYLGETVIGTTVLNTSANIGRFTPDHFETLVTHGCTGGSTFTYSGQPFTVAAYARNHNNLTTVNYHSNFAFGVNLSDVNALATPTGSFTNNNIADTSFSLGIGNQTNLIYTFTSRETVPDVLEIRSSDITDTVITSNGFTEGTTEIRSGRMHIENSFGSELVDMAITAQAEYYDAATNNYIVNTTDTCTTIDVVLTDPDLADALVIGDGSTAGETCIWDDAKLSSNLAGSTDYACIADATKPQFSEPTTSGSFNLYLKAPGENKTGDISIKLLSTPTWLQLDEDNNGTPDGDPTGTASFGLYRGDDRVIYWREVF